MTRLCVLNVNHGDAMLLHGNDSCVIRDWGSYTQNSSDQIPFGHIYRLIRRRFCSCPLPRCANNPIPRSLPWLDLRRKGPALA